LVLAIGKKTPLWVVKRGFSMDKAFLFSYFLPDVNLDVLPHHNDEIYSFIFVGRFIGLKRLDVLISVFKEIRDLNFELVVIGAGPMEHDLREVAIENLAGKVRWLGCLQMQDVHREIAKADCLILPSRYDGWGAVVTEAMMRGTPVIVSDACGSSVAVEASGFGGVFAVHDIAGLKILLLEALYRGALSREERVELAVWAKSLGAQAGAEYLMKIVDHLDGSGVRPQAPWDICLTDHHKTKRSILR